MEKGFLLFYDWLEPLSLLSAADFRTVLLGAIAYQTTGVEPELRGLRPKGEMVRMFLFSQIRRRLTRSAAAKESAGKSDAAQADEVTDHGANPSAEEQKPKGRKSGRKGSTRAAAVDPERLKAAFREKLARDFPDADLTPGGGFRIHP